MLQIIIVQENSSQIFLSIQLVRMYKYWNLFIISFIFGPIPNPENDPYTIIPPPHA